MTRVMRSTIWELSMRRSMRWWGQRRRMSFNAMHAPQNSAPAEVGRGSFVLGRKCGPLRGRL